MSKTKTTCMAPGCENVVSARGNCSTHYNSLRHIIERSKGSDELVTWELLAKAGYATIGRPGPHLSKFSVGVLAALAERRKGKESTP